MIGRQAMLKNTAKIDRELYSELNLILWDTANRYVTEQHAFQAYETRWKHVTEERLTDAEKELITHLIKKIGKGLFLAA